MNVVFFLGSAIPVENGGTEFGEVGVGNSLTRKFGGGAFLHFFILSSAVGQERPRREGDRSCPRAGGRMKRETSCAPSKFGYLGVQIYLTLPRTPPQNIASNRRLEEGDYIHKRKQTKKADDRGGGS